MGVQTLHKVSSRSSSDPTPTNSSVPISENKNLKRLSSGSVPDDSNPISGVSKKPRKLDPFPLSSKDKTSKKRVTFASDEEMRQTEREVRKVRREIHEENPKVKSAGGLPKPTSRSEGLSEDEIKALNDSRKK
jgi:hypothetical protein